ncbi:MAG: trimethylamine methyltransferase family protein [Actinomycetota bacterium]|nr:trimethylamine methyltransferase family protein [Actinomycetota bacterium]
MSDTDTPRRRGGGRAARVAARQANPAEDKKAVRPGLPGGRYSPLSEAECREVYETALWLLSEVGMGDPIEEFIEVVTAGGGGLDNTGRLRFPRNLVEDAVGSAATEFTWWGLDADRSIQVGGDRVHFGTAGAAVSVWDHETRRHRESTLLDIYDVARLVDTLEHVHFHVRTLVPRDMLEARDLDVNTAYALAMGTTKPLGTSFFQPEHVHETVDMFDVMLGGSGSFRERPFCVANNTFVVPPLRYAEDAARSMVAQVRTGMPINLLSAGQAGATSPAALAGSLAQALAECLSALTCVNLLEPGHPCVMGLWPFVSDLRTGAMTGGSGEEALLNAAAAQVANWLGLPSGVAAGMADSKTPDNQAGHEKGLTVALAAHAGANLVYESAGMLASLLACSFEALVIDNDMLGAINRTIRGIEIDNETLAAEIIRNVVHGPSHFLGDDQTLAMMQTEYIYPVVGDRLSPDDWFDAGATSVDERARKHASEVLSTHFPSHIGPEVDAAVRAQFQIHLPISELTGNSRW